MDIKQVARHSVLRLRKAEALYLFQVRKADGPSRLLKFGFSQLYPAFETGSVVLVECH
jgi:hypothetical protein